MKIFIFISLSILLTLSLAVNLSAQITWARTYGGLGDDSANSIKQTTDGGYIVAGAIDSFGAGGIDAWVLKLDFEGNIEWEKTYGGSDYDMAFSIEQTTDGGYIVAGQTRSFGAGDYYDAWILKLDSLGNIEWQKTYGGLGDDDAVSIHQTSDGGYIVVGRIMQLDPYIYAAWVLKLDSIGNIEWQKRYGNSDVSSIQQTLDGGYIAAGLIGSFIGGAWVLKLDSGGNIEWQKSYGGSGTDWFSSIQQTVDGGYIAAGGTESFGRPNYYDCWVLKFDSIGNIEWQKTYGGLDIDTAYVVQQTSDGGYIAAGWTQSFSVTGYDVWLLKLDFMGNILWQKTYAGSYEEWAHSIQETTDGGFIVAGETLSFGFGGGDYWILKLDSEGNINPSCTFINDTDVTPFDTTSQIYDTDAAITATSAIITDTSVTGTPSNGIWTNLCGAMPNISNIDKKKNPFRLKVNGSNFHSDLKVYIGYDPTPWENVKYKGDSLIVLKGGSKLKAKFPKDYFIRIMVINGDGGYYIYYYMRSLE